jgi:membrane protein implicated in regulation of membrane protease activity
MDSISWSYWMALGFVLCGLEMLLPGFVLVWFGTASLIVGAASFLLPGLDWGIQVGVFAILSGVLFFASRRFLASRPKNNQADLINDRARSMIGQFVTLSEPIRHGQGKVFISSTLWRIKGEDASTGDTIKVVGIDGDQLLVEKVPA